MPFWRCRFAALLFAATAAAVSAMRDPDTPQRPLVDRPLVDDNADARDVSVSLFASLERMSRLVDISYCVGNTGISKPFSCASRCKEFPSLTLATTWSTGPLLFDSCGYIAVDHGAAAGSGPGRNVTAPGPELVVAFRGTYSITNTVIDLGTVPQKYVPYPSPDGSPDHECRNCTVHMGFLMSWQKARETVVPELRRLRERHPDYPIHLVGHSLGGAVAALAALELRVSLGRANVRVTTFGEPRIGNDGLARYVDDAFGLAGGDDGGGGDPEKRAFRRVTHMDDPVPLLPPGEWGYRPHAGEIYISKTELSPSLSDLRACEGDNDQDCIGGADGSVADLLPWRGRRRHGTREEDGVARSGRERPEFPSRLKLWQLFFAHRDYFWRLGLCVPGGDPANWGRDKYGS